MHISYAKVENYRALQSISVPLNKFSILLGENDVGKTSFLFALDAFFSNKKITAKDDFFKNDSTKGILIELTFDNIPDDAELKKIQRADGKIVISKMFALDKDPVVGALKDDGSSLEVDKKVFKKWFSSDGFHLIPVRRDLTVQFSMAKTALLGKTLRAKMKSAVDSGSAKDSLETVEKLLKDSILEPQNLLQGFLQEQMHNQHIKLDFKDLDVDPVEGVTFIPKLSDDRVEDVLIQNRGAGTQNNLIIALFRLVARFQVGPYFIFAMEEPENSLHPKAQRQLLSVLQDISRQSQVICTTHSPVFIERSKFENNIILTRTVKGNTVAKVFDISRINELRIDLGIRPSDALLKGGGNCALIVEGNTEEEAFPVLMEMIGLSEFQLGIAIINLQGSDREKASKTARLLSAYGIPCVIVLDKNAQSTANDLEGEKAAALKNIKKIFCLKKGNIEDYYPLEIVADVMNEAFSPQDKVKASEFDSNKHGDDRITDFVRVMKQHNIGQSKSYLKKSLGSIGTKMMRERKMEVDPELKEIFLEVQKIVETG